MPIFDRVHSLMATSHGLPVFGYVHSPLLLFGVKPKGHSEAMKLSQLLSYTAAQLGSNLHASCASATL